ncbi:MAG: hydroxyethylthiazole kinase [Candidatus Spyradocola sp.]|jgi:hydroxyethylthiazole kinase
MLEIMLQNVRDRAPLVHNITNYVTVNDCANILLACGASPIMADDPDDAEEITAVCAALNLNIGTLNARTIPAMERAGRRANALHHPVLLDPVGAGASSLRTNTAARLLDELQIAAVRGNVSEIRALLQGARATRGVDAALEDRVTEDNLPQAVSFAQSFAQKTGAVVAMTGAIDVVADAERAYVIRNGCAMMGRITGSGCMLSAMTAAYLAANPDHPLEACAAAVCAMGVCGEIARDKTLAEGAGNATFRNHLIDAIYNLTPEDLKERARYEVR